MPAKNAPKKAAPVEPESAEKAVENVAENATEPVEEEIPLNRAERRARGKGKAAPQPTARGKVVGQHGPAHSQRMWSNRRSGG